MPVALVGGLVLAGPDGVSVFGSNTVQVGDDQIDIQVSTLFGSTEVVVPDGVRVDSGGVVIFGSLECKRACAAASTRVVHVRGVGAFGSVTIKTQSEAKDDSGD